MVFYVVLGVKISNKIIGIFNENVNNKNTNNNSNIAIDDSSDNFKGNTQSLFSCDPLKSGASSAYTTFPQMSQKKPQTNHRHISLTRADQ